jgi:hypothetical protein
MVHLTRSRMPGGAIWTARNLIRPGIALVSVLLVVSCISSSGVDAGGGSGGGAAGAGGAGGGGACPFEAAGGGAVYPSTCGQVPFDGGFDINFPAASRMAVAGNRSIPLLVVGGGSEIRGYGGSFYFPFSTELQRAHCDQMALGGQVTDVISSTTVGTTLVVLATGPARVKVVPFSTWPGLDPFELASGTQPTLAAHTFVGQTRELPLRVVEWTSTGVVVTDPTRACWNLPWSLPARTQSIPARSFVGFGARSFALATESPSVYSSDDFSVTYSGSSNPGAVIDHLIPVSHDGRFQGLIGWNTASDGGARLQSFPLDAGSLLTGPLGPVVALLRRSITGDFMPSGGAADTIALIDGSRVRVFQPTVLPTDITLLEVASYDVADPRDLVLWDVEHDGVNELLVLSGVAPQLRIFRADGG